MGNQVCVAPAVAADAAGADELKQLSEEAIKAEEETAARLKLYAEVAQGEPMWRSDAREHSIRVEEEAAAAVATMAQQAAEKAAEEEVAAKAAAEASAPPKGAGVWAAGEADKKDEEAKKKAEEPKKKKKASEPTKKRKEEPKAAEAPKPADTDEALKKAIAEREKAWKAKTQKQKDELSKKMISAAKQGNVPDIQNLLDKGASVNCEDGDGWTPLIRAADAGEKGTIEVLLKQGANAKAAVKLGEYGQTALHFAARHGHQEIAEMLAPVSNLKAKNHLGKTAREVASAEGHKDLSKWIRAQEKALEKAE